MALAIQLDREKLADFCRRHHILRLSVFGSAVRDDFGADSDVDFLYVFHPDHQPGWNITDVEEELARLVGRKIDFVPEVWLTPAIRRLVLPTREVLFEDPRFAGLAEQLVRKGERCLSTTGS